MDGLTLRTGVMGMVVRAAKMEERRNNRDD